MKIYKKIEIHRWPINEISFQFKRPFLYSMNKKEIIIVRITTTRQNRRKRASERKKDRKNDRLNATIAVYCFGSLPFYSVWLSSSSSTCVCLQFGCTQHCAHMVQSQHFSFRENIDFSCTRAQVFVYTKTTEAKKSNEESISNVFFCSE